MQTPGRGVSEAGDLHHGPCASGGVPVISHGAWPAPLPGWRQSGSERAASPGHLGDRAHAQSRRRQRGQLPLRRRCVLNLAVGVLCTTRRLGLVALRKPAALSSADCEVHLALNCVNHLACLTEAILRIHDIYTSVPCSPAECKRYKPCSEWFMHTVGALCPCLCLSCSCYLPCPHCACVRNILGTMTMFLPLLHFEKRENCCMTTSHASHHSSAVARCNRAAECPWAGLSMLSRRSVPS